MAKKRLIWHGMTLGLPITESVDHIDDADF